MTDHTPTRPDGWSEASDTVPGAFQTFVYHRGQGERVLVRLMPSSNTADTIQLEVSSIEATATVQRHDFVVSTHDSKRDGVENMISLMEIVSERIPSDDGEDERLRRAVERCIEECDTPD